MTKAYTIKAQTIRDLRDTIYHTGVELQRVSRAMIDEDTIAQVLRAQHGNCSEAEAHDNARGRLEVEREYLIVRLTEAHRELEQRGVEA